MRSDEVTEQPGDNRRMTVDLLTGAALTRLAREESGRVLAILARQFGDLDLADEAVQDALAEGSAHWPAAEFRITQRPG